MSRRHEGATEPRQVARFRRVGRWLTSNVRRLRARAGLTQLQLAEKAQVSLQVVNRLESATVMPNISLNALIAIAHALGCDPHELLVPTDAPKPRGVGRPPTRDAKEMPETATSPRPRGAPRA
jgi:transcriptional regulator with XRE-family HTH domain